jgi:hypothetical protein
LRAAIAAQEESGIIKGSLRLLHAVPYEVCDLLLFHGSTRSFSTARASKE